METLNLYKPSALEDLKFEDDEFHNDTLVPQQQQ